MSEIKLTYLPDILEISRHLVPDLDKRCLTRDFRDTKRFSPVIYDEDEAMPEIDSPLYDTWWIEQYRRCIMGYIVPNATKRGHDIWIPGRMYFYLNFWVIFAKLDTADRKEVRSPKFTSLDYFKYMCIEMMFMEKLDLAFPKARQKGFSEYAASNLAYNFLFLPSSVSVVVAGMGDYAEKTMSNVIRGLDYLGNTEFAKRRAPNRADYIKSLYKEDWINEETGEKRTIIKGYGSEVYCITAKDNPQALSRLSPFMVIYEEMGKWKQGLLKQTSSFVKPSLIAEGIKTGYQIFIGTGGDMDESVQDVQDMVYKPEAFGLLEFDNIWEEEGLMMNKKVAAFVPSYEFLIIDEDGNTLIEESKQEMINRWAKKDKSELYTAMISEPFYLSQMFMISTGGFFGDVLLQRMNERKRYLLTHPEENCVFRARLVWKDVNDWSKGVIMEPDENGIYHITQTPECDQTNEVWVNLYTAATDSYDKSESNSSESQGSCTIWKRTLDASHTRKHWVARVTERPTEDEGGSYKFYEDTIKLCVYYGNAINLIEYSNVMIFEYYKRKNCQYLLRERPSMLVSTYVKEPAANQKYGIEQSFVPHALRILRDSLQANDCELVDKIHDIYILERFCSFKNIKGYNCDITISCAFNVSSEIEDDGIQVYSNKEVKECDYGGYIEKGGTFEFTTI